MIIWASVIKSSILRLCSNKNPAKYRQQTSKHETPVENIRSFLTDAEEHPKPKGSFRLDENGNTTGETITDPKAAVSEVQK